MLSSTVTSAVQVDTFPYASVAVKVTTLVPTLLQSKSLGFELNVMFNPFWLQLSVVPPSRSAPVIETSPFASSSTVMFWQITIGSTLSSTVTFEVQVDTFPLTSVTVSVTVFAPMLEQSNVFGSTTKLAMAQLSAEPLSTSAGIIEAFPAASSCTVMSWQIAEGSTLSSTVTVEVHVDTFPFTSVTVSVTVFAPTSEQSKLVSSSTRLAIAQLSEEPLSISKAVIEAVPSALSCTVMSWQTALGSISSSTVTSAVQVDTLPFTSVTVNVTTFTPTSVQLNSVLLAEMDAIAQLSVLPASISPATIEANPEAFN